MRLVCDNLCRTCLSANAEPVVVQRIRAMGKPATLHVAERGRL